MRCGPELRRLISHEPRLGERLDVHAMDTIGRRLYELHFGGLKIASRDVIQPLLEDAAKAVGSTEVQSAFFTD